MTKKQERFIIRFIKKNAALVIISEQNTMLLQLLRQILRNAASTKALTDGKVAGVAKPQAFDLTARHGRTSAVDLTREQAEHLTKSARTPSNDHSYISTKVNADIYKALLKPSVSKRFSLLRPLDVFLSSLQKALFQKRKANQFRINGQERTEAYRPIDMASIVKEDNSPLMKAIASGNQKQASTLIAWDFEEIRNYRGDYQTGRDINTANRDGLTPLHIAVEKSDSKIIGTLLTVPKKNLINPVNHPEMYFAKVFSIPVEQRDARGFTPMQIALQKDDHKMVDLLMDKGVKLIPYAATNKDLTLAGRYLQRATEASERSGGATPEFNKRMSRMTNSIVKTLVDFQRGQASLRTNVTSATLANELSTILKSNPVAQKSIDARIASNHAVKQTLTKMGVDMTPFHKEPTLPERWDVRIDEADFARVFTSPAARQRPAERQGENSRQNGWGNQVRPQISDSQFRNTVLLSLPSVRTR